MTAADCRIQLEAQIWRILTEYSHAPRLEHVEHLLVWADIYATARAADIDEMRAKRLAAAEASAAEHYEQLARVGE